jgi:hypothetical protein
VLAFQQLADHARPFEQERIGQQVVRRLLLALAEVAHADVVLRAVLSLDDGIVGHHARPDHQIAGQQIATVGARAPEVEHGGRLILCDDCLGGGRRAHHLDATERQDDRVAIQRCHPGPSVATPHFLGGRERSAQVGQLVLNGTDNGDGGRATV